MGRRTDAARAAREELERPPVGRGLTRGDERRDRPPIPLASHLLAAVGLGLVILDLPLVWLARSHGWNVTDGLALAMILLFVGGIGLVGVGALIRHQAAGNPPN